MMIWYQIFRNAPQGGWFGNRVYLLRIRLGLARGFSAHIWYLSFFTHPQFEAKNFTLEISKIRDKRCLQLQKFKLCYFFLHNQLLWWLWQVSGVRCAAVSKMCIMRSVVRRFSVCCCGCKACVLGGILKIALFENCSFCTVTKCKMNKQFQLMQNL